MNQEAISIRYSVTQDARLGEPVILDMLVENATTGSVAFDLGWNRVGALRFVLISPAGQRTTVQPQVKDGIALSSRVAIQPKSTWKQAIFLDEWLDFREPGVFELFIEFRGNARDEAGMPVPVKSSEGVEIRVSPSDDAGANRRCNALVDKIVPRSFEFMEAAKSLSLFRTHAAFGCLRRVIEADPNLASLVMEGYVRTGGEAAKVELSAFVQSPNQEVSAAAKNALARIRTR
jgi:hypothetical protein